MNSIKRNKKWWIIGGILFFIGCPVLGSLLPDVETTESKSSSTATTSNERSEPQEFKNMDDWEKARCGKKNYIRDFVMDYWRIKEFSLDGRSGIKPGWISKDEAAQSDFPKYFTWPLRSDYKNAAGMRKLVRQTLVFGYSSCDPINEKVIDKGWR